MTDPFWVLLAEAIQNWTAAVALFVGGGWALYRFGVRRESETALSIDLTYASAAYSALHLVSFDVVVANKGAVRLGAKRKQGTAYEDDVEVLANSVDLLLRRIPSDLPVDSQVGWFVAPNTRSPQPEDLEFDLAAEYAIRSETDFWMEPGESYHVGACVILEEGAYLAMVTFVGDRSDAEFWRRVFLIQVPAPAPTAREFEQPGTRV